MLYICNLVHVYNACKVIFYVSIKMQYLYVFGSQNVVELQFKKGNMLSDTFIYCA